MRNTCYKFWPLIFLLLQSSCHKPYYYLRIFCSTTLVQKSSLQRNEKNTRENCRTQTRRSLFWLHTWRCSTGTLLFTQFPNSSTAYLTNLFWLLQFSRTRVEIWRHFSLTKVGCFEQWTLLNAENDSLVTDMLQSTLQAIFPLIIYPLNFLVSIERPDSATLIGKITFYTTL